MQLFKLDEYPDRPERLLPLVLPAASVGKRQV